MKTARIIRRKPLRFRWVAPDGRRGRWNKARLGAVRAAVCAASSAPGLKVKVCDRTAAALWPGLAAEGWTLEKSS